MSLRVKKITLLVLAAALLVGVSRVQTSLNRDRNRLGLTRVEPLQNAPPVLAFTTVALGGFRGLISNALWMRATQLQDEDKFFEMAQLASWITKLEPHFVQVWLVQGWNMAYNISVKFKDFPDRWRWVKAGIELLRDDGLRYNPNETLIYRELAWFFQHKMGHNLDDANMLYKQQWANEMARVLGTNNISTSFSSTNRPYLEELINPQTDDAKRRYVILTNEYKMDPKFMKQVDDDYGPLEWRLPEPHAIYWAARGLKVAQENPTKIKKDDLITLRRVIYQSMQLTFHRGRLISNPFAKYFEFGPNLEIIPKTNAAYEEAMEEDAQNRDHISRAHRNFLRDAVYFLYEHNRIADAAKWYTYIGEKYPDKHMLDGQTNTLPSKLTLDQYVLARVQEDIGETDMNRVTSAIEGQLAYAYSSLALDEDERYMGHKLLARKIWDSYQSKIPAERQPAIGLRPFEEIDRQVLLDLIDPQKQLLPVDAQLRIRTKLGLPPPAAAPTTASTNTPPASVTAPATAGNK
jgi:hypothetical protein